MLLNSNHEPQPQITLYIYISTGFDSANCQNSKKINVLPWMHSGLDHMHGEWLIFLFLMASRLVACWNTRIFCISFWKLYLAWLKLYGILFLKVPLFYSYQNFFIQYVLEILAFKNNDLKSRILEIFCTICIG